jgi:hypothetical protein
MGLENTELKGIIWADGSRRTKKGDTIRISNRDNIIHFSKIAGDKFYIGEYVKLGYSKNKKTIYLMRSGTPIGSCRIYNQKYGDKYRIQAICEDLARALRCNESIIFSFEEEVDGVLIYRR